MKILNYFEEGGFSCPKNCNPADYIMQLMQDNHQNEKALEILFEMYDKELG